MKLLTKFTPRAQRKGQSGRVALPVLVAGMLGVALILRAALPLWDKFGTEGTPGPAAPGPEAAAGGPVVDLAALQALTLFDSAPVTEVSGIPPALNTALNLRLEGVILAQNAADSRAVIVSGAERGSYRAGATLPAGANIRVDSIARDHVVIDNRGQREVLWLYAGASAPADRVTSTSNQQLALPPGVDARVVRTAARLAEIVSVAPENVNGRLIGYRLTPGARLKDFVNAGFMTNDIIVAANGIALNEMTNLPKLYSLMDGATEVSFSLLRDGMPMDLRVTLSPDGNVVAR